MIIDKKDVKRCAVFVFFDKDGIVDRYIETFLNGIKENVERIVVVCNGDVDKRGMETFRNITEEVIVRPNEGYDITAYKCGLTHVSFDSLKEYDEVLLLNSTMFGPIYPFSEMFDSMNRDRKSVV